MALIPHGKERRSIKRHQLNDYLKIYNRNTMREMGNIGNISCNGLMLISCVSCFDWRGLQYAYYFTR